MWGFWQVLGASITDNQRLRIKISKPAAENKSNDEGQGVEDMIYKLFLCQVATEVEVDKFSGNLLKYQYFSGMLKEVVESNIKDPVERLTHI